MTRTFSRKQNKVIASILSSILTFSLFFALSVPLNVHADNPFAPSAVIGTPLIGSEGFIDSSDYDCSNYYELVTAGLYYSLPSIFGQSVLYSISDFRDWFDYAFPVLANLWKSENNFTPSYLANFYYSLSSRTYVAFSAVVVSSSLAISPVSYNGSGTYYLGSFPKFVRYDNDSSDTLVVCFAEGAFSSNPISSFSSISDTGSQNFLLDYDSFAINSVANVTYEEVRYNSNQFFYSFGDFINRNIIFRNDRRVVNSVNIIDMSSVSVNYNYNDYTFNFPFSGSHTAYHETNYYGYSNYQYTLPTPSPIPTVMPTISPTPMPLPLDPGVDGFSDGSTLGFLQSLSRNFENISGLYAVIPWITGSISYMYHYAPWLSLLLVIPMISFISFLIGRNKS